MHKSLIKSRISANSWSYLMINSHLNTNKTRAPHNLKTEICMENARVKYLLIDINDDEESEDNSDIFGNSRLANTGGVHRVDLSPIKVPPFQKCGQKKKTIVLPQL